MAAEDDNNNLNRSEQVRTTTERNRYSDSRNTYWYWKSMPHHVHLAEYESQFVGAWRPFMDEISDGPLKTRTNQRVGSAGKKSIGNEPRPVTATNTVVNNRNNRGRELLSTDAELPSTKMLQDILEPFSRSTDVNNITSPAVASGAESESETIIDQSQNPRTDGQNKRPKRKSIWRRTTDYIRDCAFYMNRRICL